MPLLVLVAHECRRAQGALEDLRDRNLDQSVLRGCSSIKNRNGRDERR